MAVARITRTCSLIAALLVAAAPLSVAWADAGRPDGDLSAYLRARVAEDAGQGNDAAAGYAAGDQAALLAYLLSIDGLTQDVPVP